MQPFVTSLKRTRQSIINQETHTMIDTPQILQTPAQHTAVIHFRIPRDEIQNVMGPGLGELTAAVAAQGITPTGPWFTHHLKMEPDSWDFEISLPVGTPIMASGRVQSGERPAMKVARTIYHGPYEGLGDAWCEFMDWIEANGHTPAADLYECYLSGPQSSPDPANWRTEFTRPLAD
jgi:effector-binding domain-containing protein